jgi:hypothetical protein
MIRVHSLITNSRTREGDLTDVTRNFSGIRGKCHLILQVFYNTDILIFLEFFLPVWLLNLHIKYLFLCRCMMNWYWKLIHVW